MGKQGRPSDLSVASFIIIRSAFYNPAVRPVPYTLRDKRNTQDDPFDEHVRRVLAAQLPEGIVCLNAPGPLITPDLVIARPDMCNGASRATLATDLARVVAIEVKKLERTRGGTVARASGMDYNTTPPCGKVRVYDANERPLDIRGFYLFICQEAAQNRAGQYYLSGLVLCDGDLLNADFEFYLSIVGERTKELGLGTYADGANRKRPMLIFANPLGISELDHKATLIHSISNLHESFRELQKVGIIRRTVRGGGERAFYCYRMLSDVPADHQMFDLTDPFPSSARIEKTQARGRFRTDLRPCD